MQNKNIKRNTGFTIIETMISVSLFIVIVMAGMSALLNANMLHNKAQNMRSIMDNLSFVMEDMSRNLRTGYNYRCYDVAGNITGDVNINFAKSCASGWGIAFEEAHGSSLSKNDQWAYYINNGKIYKSTDGAASFFQLIPDEVDIDSVSSFVVSGALPGASDNQQPFVTIKLVGEINYKGVISPFSLQTSVSQRKIDI